MVWAQENKLITTGFIDTTVNQTSQLFIKLFEMINWVYNCTQLSKLWLLYGKPYLREISVLWLVLSRSGFCSTDRFHGNDPMRVFLFWSEAGKFKICNQNRRRTFLNASHRKCILLSETECHITNYLLTQLSRAVRSVRTKTTKGPRTLALG